MTEPHASKGAHDSEDLGRVKGAALREFLRYLHGTLPDGELERRLQALDEETRSALDISKSRVGVLASSWYPASAIHTLLDQAFALDANVDYTRDIQAGAAAVMTATLHGIYKVLFRTMMSPARYAKHAQKLWSRYYDRGQVTKIEAGPTAQRTEIRDWTSHHRVLCDLNYAAARHIYEAMGCHDVEARRIACVSHGDDHCGFEITWRDDG